MSTLDRGPAKTVPSLSTQMRSPNCRILSSLVDVSGCGLAGTVDKLLWASLLGGALCPEFPLLSIRHHRRSARTMHWIPDDLRKLRRISSGYGPEPTNTWLGAQRSPGKG
jgi:hypothetical protein